MKSILLDKSIVLRFIALTATWWLLTSGAWSSWLFGFPFIIAALMIPRFLPPLPDFSCDGLGIVRFTFYFFSQSLIGGVDVARRAFHPQCPLDPDVYQYQFGLSNRLAAMFFANAISLLPGTLSVDLQDGHVVVHALDRQQNIPKALKTLEAHVAGIFEAKGGGH